MDGRSKIYRDVLAFAVVGGLVGYFFFYFSTKWHLVETEVLVNNESGSLDSINPVASLIGGDKRRRKMYDSLKILHSQYTIEKISEEILSNKSTYRQTLRFMGKKLCRLSGATPEQVRSCVAYFFEKFLKSGIDFNANVIKLKLETPFPEEGQAILYQVLAAWSRSNEEVAISQKRNSLQTLRLGMEEAINTQKDAKRRLEKFLKENPKIASDKVVDEMFERASKIDGTIMELKAKKDSLADTFGDIEADYIQRKYSGNTLSPRRKQEIQMLNEDLFKKNLTVLPEVQAEKKRISSLLEKLQSRRGNIQGELDDLPPKIAEFYMLKFEFEASMKVLVSYKEGLFHLDLSLASSSSNIFVITPPKYKGEPYHPKLLVCISIGSILSLMLFALFTYIYIGSKNFFVPGKLDKIRTIARIPKISNFRPGRRQSHPWNNLLEAKNLILFNGTLPRFERSIKMLELIGTSPNKIITVTGIEANIGKSFCSLGVAWACFSRLGSKVLLVDFDTRRSGPRFLKDQNPRIRSYDKSPFIGDLFNVQLPYTSESTMDVLVLPENFTSSYSTASFLKFIEKYAKDKYNYIVIDTPPFKYFGDSFDLIQKSDYTILVSSAYRTTVDSMTQVLDELDILGISHEKIFNIFNYDNTELKFEKGYQYYQNSNIQSGNLIAKKKVG